MTPFPIFKKRLARIKRKGERQKKLFELRQKYDQYYPSRNGTKVSNIMLIVVITAITLYTAAALYIQYSSGMEVSSTLSTLWYAFWTTEILVLGGIKISKVIKDYEKYKTTTDEEIGG